jgi:hypothetical protein
MVKLTDSSFETGNPLVPCTCRQGRVIVKVLQHSPEAPPFRSPKIWALMKESREKRCNGKEMKQGLLTIATDSVGHRPDIKVERIVSKTRLLS